MTEQAQPRISTIASSGTSTTKDGKWRKNAKVSILSMRLRAKDEDERDVIPSILYTRLLTGEQANNEGILPPREIPDDSTIVLPHELFQFLNDGGKIIGYEQKEDSWNFIGEVGDDYD